MKIRRLVFIGIVLVILLNSCSRSVSYSSNVKLPDIGISDEEINTKFQLGAPATGNSFSTNDHILIEIVNISKNSIKFEPDHGARLFMLQSSRWQEIANLTTYVVGDIPDQGTTPGDSPLVLKPAGNGNSSDKFTSVSPELPNIKQQATVLIILTGNVMVDGKKTEEKTSGYIIVNLNP